MAQTTTATSVYVVTAGSLLPLLGLQLTLGPMSDRLSDIRLQEVFQAVVVSRLMYASMAWGRCVTATDIQRFDAILRRSNCCGYCPLDLPDFSSQMVECDDRLLNRIRHNPQHILYSLLPPPSAASKNYVLRPHCHDRSHLDMLVTIKT